MAGSIRKLVVEVVDARNLLPKDGLGTSSPYVILDFYGQRRKTTSVMCDLNPVWNETVSFKVGKPTSHVFTDMLEVDIYHDKNIGPTSRNNFLGRVRLNSRQFVKKGEEALIYYPLEKKNWFYWVQGEIGLKIYFTDEVIPPPPPPPTPPLPLPEEVKKSDPPPPPSSEPEAVPAPQTAAEGVPEASHSDPPPPQPTEAIPPAPAPAPAPADNGAPATPQPAALPPENVGPEAEPAVEGVDEPLGRTEVEHEHMMASIATGPIPEVKVGGVQGQRPISRAASVSSFLSDASPRPLSPAASVSGFVSDASDNISMERASLDLVEKMHYLFIRVVKARSLPTAGNPVVKIVVSGSQVTSKPARKNMFLEWDQTFAFGRQAPDSSSILQVSVWDPVTSASMSNAAVHGFLGGICFDVTEIPLRDPPDSPLAPQWYRLEGGGARRGDLMLAAWVGTQADESFPEAWKTDTAGNPTSRAKVYQSPKLWYLRSTVMEAQDISGLTKSTDSSFQVKAQLGFQVQKTKLASTRNGTPSWNEDFMFVAAEPFSDMQLLFFLIEYRESKEQVVLGVASVPLVSIERRVDDRNVLSKWVTFEDPNHKKRLYKGRIHLRVCFDGGYHVMDEAAHVCSDYRPTAKQLWKPAIGTVELGIIGCKNLLPMKTIDSKGSTDSYAVAKYGNKWVRTRTVHDALDPKWNEQYTWRVYDPSTVLTIGVFDSWEVFESEGKKESTRPDFRIGKVRIRISTLETGKVYKNVYPLLLLSAVGLKKMGEIEVAVRFARAANTLDILQLYSLPQLPIMHHIKPIGVMQQEMLRSIAVKIVCGHLSRSEPPLRREVIAYMLDADLHTFSMRKVRANWFRIISVIAGVIDIIKWIDDRRAWRNPTATVLVHALLVMLVWFPDLIIPTLAFYVFVVGVWNYRLRSQGPLPHFDPKISLADTIDGDELEEEFDSMPCSRPNEMVRARYDKLRMLGARVQTLLGDFATQGERVQALVTWRDPRATGIFIGLCFVVAFVLYLLPSKMVAMAFGFYYLRHPIFRDRMPSPALNFFRRLPSLSDRIL